MDDLISRKRALEEMTFSCGIEQDCVLYVPLRDVNNHLKSLPSVQPETDLQSSCNEVVTDCISRQTTADEIGKRAERCAERFGTDDPFREGLIIAKTIVECAPSAQPERKKGKWFLIDTMYACDQCYSVFYETSQFCPNCGADMQGSEQE